MTDKKMIDTALAEYKITDAAIAKIKADYMSLVVKNPQDVEGYEQVHRARMDVKNRRVDIEKTRKKLKQDALDYGRAVDAEAKRITGLLEPVENYLQEQEDIVVKEKERIKKEEEEKEKQRIQQRIDRLFGMGITFNSVNYLLPFAPSFSVPSAIINTCPDEQFKEIVGKFQSLIDTEKKRLAEEEAKKKEEEEKLAAQRAEQEKEAQRLAALAEEQRIKEEKLKAEQDAIIKEKERIQHEKDIELAKKEAAERALKEAEEKAKREQEEKTRQEAARIAEEQRQEALKPDKEKAGLYFKSIIQHLQKSCPAIKDKAINKIIADLEAVIEKTVDESMTKLEKI